MIGTVVFLAVVWLIAFPFLIWAGRRAKRPKCELCGKTTSLHVRHLASAPPHEPFPVCEMCFRFPFQTPSMRNEEEARSIADVNREPETNPERFLRSAMMGRWALAIGKGRAYVRITRQKRLSAMKWPVRCAACGRESEKGTRIRLHLLPLGARSPNTVLAAGLFVNPIL